MTTPVLQPVTLAGEFVRLEPLTAAHADALWEVARDPELWQWIPMPVDSRESMAAYIAAALRDQAAGTVLPFVMIAADGAVAGSTRFAAFSAVDRRIEIGWTWIGKRWQRSAVNTEAKWLLLRHAFEALKLVRVELKTDALNERSRRAILRLGAMQEGVLRRHRLTHSGRWRDTVYFSILADEWPAVQRNLRAKLAQRVSA